MIELIDVKKAFNHHRPNEHWAVNGVSLTLEGNRLTVFQGPSGSGKTTLLTLIGCLARPTSGRVRLDGKDVSGFPERFLTEIRRGTFGFVFQQYHLLRGISVLENVMLPGYPAAPRYGTLRRRALELLERFELAHKAHAKVEWLSGGESQRVAIARALINDPAVVIADEPTAHLDTALAKGFLTIAEELRAQGKTLMISSHDPLVCEAPIVDRLVRLRDGRLAESA